MKEFKTIIIGAGVIGTSLARALSIKDKSSCALIEKEIEPALHTSGRNSGVIHSGFNPKPGTLKARLCVEGNRRLKEFCEKNNIPKKDVGTLVVAQNEQEVPNLTELLYRGSTNGVPNLKLINAVELKRLEPASIGYTALHSPSGAITNGKLVTQAFAEEAKRNGVQFFFGQKVLALNPIGEKIEVRTSNESFLCERLINCAGLYADHIAHLMDVGLDYTIIPFRGEYFKTIPEKSDIIHSMVYPVPNLDYPFLGVHWTKTIEGQVIIGPNATMAFSRESYSPFNFNVGEFISMLSQKAFWALWKSAEFRHMAFTQLQISLSKKRFVQEARKLIPTISETDFIKGKSGNRPQLVSKKGTLIEDLLIEKKGGSLHVLNAISPGFTCSMAFADYLIEKLEE